MKRKKYLCILATAILTLSACGSNSNTDSSIEKANTEQVVASVKESEIDIVETNIDVTSTDVASTDDVVVTDEMRAEAERLWSEFLDKVSVIETDSRYYTILYLAETTANSYADSYAKATGRSKDEYLSMAGYERFLWYSTYIVPYNAITSSDYDYYCGSLNNWTNHSVYLPIHNLASLGTDEMAEAYTALMDWNYAFLMQTGSIYNFITGQSIAEENPDYVPLDPEKRSAEQAQQAQQELEQFQQELEQLQKELLNE